MVNNCTLQLLILRTAVPRSVRDPPVLEVAYNVWRQPTRDFCGVKTLLKAVDAQPLRDPRLLVVREGDKPLEVRRRAVLHKTVITAVAENTLAVWASLTQKLALRLHDAADHTRTICSAHGDETSIRVEEEWLLPLLLQTGKALVQLKYMSILFTTRRVQRHREYQQDFHC